MEHEKEEMLRTYAWSYFSFHADQRMKTFNFFLIVAGLSAGGITTLLHDGGNPFWICLLGIMLTLLSLIFWIIDCRNKQLVRNGEAALKYLDTLHSHQSTSSGEPHVLSIIDRDDFHTKKSGHCSYSMCLALVFSLFALLGIFFLSDVFIYETTRITHLILTVVDPNHYPLCYADSVIQID